MPHLSHRKAPGILRLCALSLLLTAGCSQEQPDSPACTNDNGFLITNVSIIDGSGSPAVPGSVRITDDLVAAVGELEACPGERVVDGGGNVLAPGFIDTHSHADRLITEMPDALNHVSQGITTAIVGQDGGSPFPLAEFFATLEAAPATMNFASYVGHNTLRTAVMGEDDKRVATEDEIAAMATLVEEEMAAGALGLATGLEYEPGIYSETTEVIALAQVAADAGGRYISHMRSEDRWLEDAVEEIILIGRETGMPVQVSHFKLAMTPLWGKAPEIIDKLNAARAEGIDITADIYPYEYWQSTMMVLLPGRDYTDRAAVEEVLENIAPADGIWMTRFTPNPEFVGMSIVEISNVLELDHAATFMELARLADEWQKEHGERAEMIIGTSMNAADINDLMAWEFTNICSDGMLNDLHPRGAGSFPRVLGRYSREQGLFTLETAVHKMTGLAATNMGFTDRGLIRAGMVADLVLFDPDTVIDNATPEDPGALSTGIESVWVSGEVVYRDGAATDARPGKVIRRP
jgi:N-acyl-D-amino-acid deacylase